MADTNRPTRTLSDIRRPSAASAAPAPAPKKAPAKKAAVLKGPVPATPENTTAEITKRSRSIWKVILSIVVIAILVAIVAGVYYYIFSA